jgi:hypothetical protein
MRRYGLYDATRGLMTALAVGVAGFLLWVATRIGVQTTARYWAAMAVVAGAGLALALLPSLGGAAHRGLRLRMSPGTFLLGFLPTLVAVGWLLMANQPGNGWHEGTITSWSRSIGIAGLVHSIGLWHGALALGFGVVLGMSFDTVPVVDEVVVADETVVDRRDATGPTWRRRPTQDVAPADEPLTAEQREAARNAQPHTVTVGPADPVESDSVERDRVVETRRD